MPCVLTQNYSLDCNDSFGGVKELWFIEKANVTIAATAGITTTITKAVGKKFWKYELIHQTADVTESKAGSRENGTNMVTQTIKFPINKMSVSLRNELELLFQNLLVAVAVDNNGTPWIYGVDFGMKATQADAKTGIKLGDRNGYEITLVGEEKVFALKVDNTSYAALATVGA